MSDAYFVGYAPRWLTLDKLYLVVAMPGTLLGLHVGGQLWNPYASHSDPRAYFDPQLASRYEGRDLRDPALVSFDEDNFVLPASDVDLARLKSRKSLWTASIPNSGTLILDLRARGRRKFILIGRQSLEEVGVMLASAGIRVEREQRAAAWTHLGDVGRRFGIIRGGDVDTKGGRAGP